MLAQEKECDFRHGAPEVTLSRCSLSCEMLCLEFHILVPGSHDTTTDARHFNLLSQSESALEYNPKSYSAWYHRKWLVSQNLVDLQRELKLLKLLLTRDTRNFHGWDYRRYKLLHRLHTFPSRHKGFA